MTTQCKNVLPFDSKETIYFIIFHEWKVQIIYFIFYLHFTWLCGSWKPQRILKKYLFWKCESWFPSEVSKLTSVCYPWNDAFSAMKNFFFQPTLCLSSWSNLDFNILSTSKWPSGPQFCERLSCNWQINDQKWSKNGHLWVIDFQDFSSKMETEQFVFYAVAFDPIKI